MQCSNEALKSVTHDDDTMEGQYTIIDYWGIGHDVMSTVEVNIGILWSTSHHVQCPNSQQVFCYIIYWRDEEDEEMKKTM